MRLILSLLVLSTSTIAFADDPAPVKTSPSNQTVDVRTMVTDDCARARKLNKTCVLEIGEEQIEGQVANGTGEGITTIDWGKAGSLIRLRRDFITEILRSAEDID